MPEPESGPEADGRSEPRKPSCWAHAVVRVAVRPSFHSFRAPVRDVSAHGLAFVHQAAVDPGTIVALQLRAGVAGTSYIRTARVAHCTPCQEGWVVGCTVSPPFSEEELEGLW